MKPDVGETFDIEEVEDEMEYWGLDDATWALVDPDEEWEAYLVMDTVRVTKVEDLD